MLTTFNILLCLFSDDEINGLNMFEIKCLKNLLYLHKLSLSTCVEFNSLVSTEIQYLL